VLLALGLAAANILLGNLNQDEGWYLLAALRTADGQWPYRDFLFTQGPVMPVVYGFLSPLWAPQGVLGGRVLTALLGLLSSAVAALLAARLAPASRRRDAAFTAWLLTACVPVHSYFTAIPKTYALTSLLLAAGFAMVARPGRWRSAAVAGALLGLAAATRISVGLALPVVGVALLLRRRDPAWRGAWLGFGVGGALALALTFGLCWLSFGDRFVFAQNYHATREGGTLGAWLALRVGFVSRSLQAYPLPWILGTGLLLTSWPWQSRRAASTIPPSPVLSATVWTVLAVTALHGLSPFPYDDYQTPVMPLLAAAVAALLWQRLDSAPAKALRAVPLLLAAAALLLAAASPLLMEWMVIRKDRFWFERKPRPDVLALRDVGHWVREAMPKGGVLLTQDAYLAVEAGSQVPAGLEMGPFSVFPGLGDEQARHHHVHTPATLEALIAATDAPLAATSGYTFALACPGTGPLPEADRQTLMDTLARYYEPVRNVPNFGQAHTTLTLWRRRLAPLGPETAVGPHGDQ
jgi:4-amino-4-deoxy-L-arabinose transferase-like glycosyltransferase